MKSVNKAMGWKKKISLVALPRLTVDNMYIPLLAMASLCGMYSGPLTRCRQTLSVFRIALNIVCFLLAAISLGFLVFCEVCCFVKQLKEGESVMAILYQISIDLSQLFLVVTFFTLGSKAFRKFLKEYRSYRERHSGLSMQRYVLIISMSFVAYACFLLSISFVQGDPSSAICNVSFEFLDIRHEMKVWPTLAFLVKVYRSHILGITFIFYMSVWFLLYVEARHFVTSFTQPEDATLSLQPAWIERGRLHHAELCDLIGCANGLVTHILAVFYGAGIPCILFILHGLVFKSISFEELYSLLFVFLGMVMDIVFITITGAALNLKMHEPLDYLFRINVESLPNKKSDIVALFVARLQGPAIGFHLYNLFTVNTSTVMMIGGTVLTYALVIIQFQPIVVSTTDTSGSLQDKTGV